MPAHQHQPAPRHQPQAVEYVVKRATTDGGVSVHVALDCGHGRGLDARHDLRRHSMDGWNVGYEGAGCAQLSLALLADALEDDDLAQDLYQTYKRQVIARIPQDFTVWRTTPDEIKGWAEKALLERAAKRGLPPADALDVWADQLGE